LLVTPEATAPCAWRNLVLGLLALHGRELAREQERGAAEVDRDRTRGGRALAGSVGAKSAGVKPLIIVSTAKL